MRTNVAAVKTAPVTYEGGRAKNITPLAQLRRAVLATLLWENQFYEDGVMIAERINTLVDQVKPSEVIELAIEARSRMKLRHVPLLLARQLSRKKLGRPMGDLLYEIIQRPDELCEFLSLYWTEKRQPIAVQVRKGLARAFRKFSAYQLAKYNRDDKIKLRDVLFLVHAKPKDDQQAATWKALINGTLSAPDTWEVALSGGNDKKATFERLMDENKLGALAFIRNLRNMHEAAVAKATVGAYSQRIDLSRVLPFRFITAARMIPQWADILEPMMLRAVEKQSKLPGHSVILVDVSGSMDATLSAKAQTTRMDAACGVAVLAREICEEATIASFSNLYKVVPTYRGLALRDAILNSQPHGGTLLGAAVKEANKVGADRLIVITDEQSHDSVSDSLGKGYVINVASYKNGVGYGKWTHIDGWSEHVLDYIREVES